jgi:hypothetical protein
MENQDARENVPRRLWDYGLVYIAEIASIIARGPNGRPGMDIRTPSDPVSTYEPGISDFKFEKFPIRARISPMHAGIKYFHSFFIQ